MSKTNVQNDKTASSSFKERLKAWWQAFKQAMSSLKTLTAMQLKEKMDMKFLRSTKATIFKAVYFVLQFVVVGAVCFLLLYACKLLSLFSLIGEVPTSIVAIVFGFMLLLSIIFTTLGLVKSLYIAKDNAVLLTLPAKPSLIFLSKLCVYYVYELRKNFIFLIPFFFAYGILKALPVWYFAWALVLFVFVSILTVLISAILSMPSLFIYRICRKYKVLQYTLIIGAIVLASWGVISLIALIPENIDILASWGTIYWDMQDFFKAFTETFTLTMGLTELIVGRSVGLRNVLFTRHTVAYLAILIGIIVVLFALCFLLSQPLFYSMASKSFEHTKRENDKPRPNKKAPILLSAVKKEWFVALRNKTIVSLVIQLVVVMPISIILLNKLYAAMSTRALGQQLSIGFNLLICLLFLTGANVNIASAYSRDGSTAYLNKVQPFTYGKLLVAKLFFNLVIGFIGIVTTTFVFAHFSGLSILQNVLFGVTCMAVYTCHLFWSGELDLMNPQYSQYATFSEQSNNPNENMSMVLCFVLAFLITLAFLLLSFENMLGAWIKVAVISIALCALKIWSYFIKIKVFYKEK